jgi:hypothetical protein
MELKNDRELDNTLVKLESLKEAYEETRTDESLNERVREVSLRSLKRLINQLTEEISRYNAGASNGGGHGRLLQNDTRSPTRAPNS